jgi:hypothetical protein
MLGTCSTVINPTFITIDGIGDPFFGNNLFYGRRSTALYAAVPVK